MGASTPETGLRPRVLVGTWCSAIFSALNASGVREVVISPGSRNTPLTAAALRSEKFRCHSVVDERSAGFFALGLARGSRQLVVLVCTSGTAAAHYYPALIEASYDGIPLLVMSADRPEELQNCGAPQTIAQANMFAEFVREAASLTAPRETKEAFARLSREVSGLFKTATGARPGPVHLNVPLRKPLEPDAPRGMLEETAVQQLLDASAVSLSAELPEPQADNLPSVEHLVHARRAATRPLLVAGPLPPGDLPHVERAAALLQTPLLQEYGPGASAGLEFIGPHLLSEAEPDLLVHFGPPAVSSSWARALDAFQGRSLVFSGTEFRDPSRRAERVVVAPLHRVADALDRALPRGRPPFHEAAMLGSAIQSRLNGALNKSLSQARPEGRLNEPLAVQQILSCCSSEHSLVLGNSLSLRLASWIWPLGTHRPQPYTARGVNGIDGMVAWSLGIAESTKRPTLALLGDVTAAHDLGSLQLLINRKTPLVLVVLDNLGGRIFDHLPVRAEVTDAEMHFWTTPPRIKFEALAAAFGINFAPVSTHTQVEPVITEALRAHRPTLIVVSTDPTSTTLFKNQMAETFCL